MSPYGTRQPPQDIAGAFQVLQQPLRAPCCAPPLHRGRGLRLFDTHTRWGCTTSRVSAARTHSPNPELVQQHPGCSHAPSLQQGPILRAGGTRGPAEAALATSLVPAAGTELRAAHRALWTPIPFPPRSTQGATTGELGRGTGEPIGGLHTWSLRARPGARPRVEKQGEKPR